MKNLQLFIVWVGFLLLISSCSKKSEIPSNIDCSKWEEYQGGPDRNQYSTLNQVTLENVKELKLAGSLY